MVAALFDFPMTPAGGLFIATMGVFVALGGALPRWRKAWLVVGGVVATVLLVTVGLRLDTGRPTALQLAFLYGSIALEGVLIALVFRLGRAAAPRTQMLWVLLAVGLHFVPMAVAFGLACLVLALACMANAAVGLARRRDVALDRLWAIDGAIKVVAGLAMLAPAVMHSFT